MRYINKLLETKVDKNYLNVCNDCAIEEEKSEVEIETQNENDERIPQYDLVW